MARLRFVEGSEKASSRRVSNAGTCPTVRKQRFRCSRYRDVADPLPKLRFLHVQLPFPAIAFAGWLNRLRLPRLGPAHAHPSNPVIRMHHQNPGSNTCRHLEGQWPRGPGAGAGQSRGTPGFSMTLSIGAQHFPARFGKQQSAQQQKAVCYDSEDCDSLGEWHARR
jgi:hypothetical protein